MINFVPSYTNLVVGEKENHEICIRTILSYDLREKPNS